MGFCASCSLVANLGEPRDVALADASIAESGTTWVDEGSVDADSAPWDMDVDVRGEGTGDDVSDGDDGSSEVLRARSVALGPTHACAVIHASVGSPDNGTVRCWGSNYAGELGRTPGAPSPIPQPVDVSPLSPLAGAAALSLATESSCALTDALSLFCWSSNLSGLYPSGVSRVSGPGDWQPAEMLVNGNPGSFTSVSLGDTGGCAVMSLGGLLCWGSLYTVMTPVEGGTVEAGSAEGGAGFLAVYPALGAASVGRAHVCALMADGSHDVACWGDNSQGQAGSPAWGTLSSPQPLHLGSAANPVTQVAAGGDHSCALMADLTAYCWGDNALGQLGNGDLVTTATPTLVRFAQPLPKPRQLALGPHHTCAVMDDDSVRCWGDNSMSQLAQPVTVAWSALPVLVYKAPGMGLPNVESVAVGGDTTCAVRLPVSKLPVSCWGDNLHGQAGQPLSAAVIPYATPMSL
jgi:hypothetical protein